MDEENLLRHSDFLPNQSGERIDNGGDDRISELPNDILYKILSFLPLNEAAATSVLSSRWSDSWKHTPNLIFNFDIVGEDVHKYIEIVNSILQSHKTRSLKQFIISVSCYAYNSDTAAVTKLLEKCLEFVFFRKVECLELSPWMDRDEMVNLGESLKTVYGNPRTLIFLQSLKSLVLAQLEVSGKDTELFLCNCPLLEVLEFYGVSLISDIEVCGSSLKRLVIHDCSGGNSIKVSAPNLSVIRFDDSEVGKLYFENVSRLVEATFDISTSEFLMHYFASAASSHNISQLQFLDIYLYDSEPFWMNAFPHMPNLKKLSIDCHYHSLLPVTRLIWACPHLKEFSLKFSCPCEEPTEDMQEEIANVGRSPHQHLRVLHLCLPYWVTVNDHLVDLVAYVSSNCIALRLIDIGGVDMPEYCRHELQSQVPNHVKLLIGR